MPELSAGRRTAPSELVLIRHGESVGNVADRVAREKDAHHLELDYRDADTPLSDVGEEQASAVGRWAASLGEQERPRVVISSPYRRAFQTAQLAVKELGLSDHIVVDERLRERDLGLFDGMTGAGIRHNYPEEAARRDEVGKFYYRPPGGESWTDVVARVRSVLTDIRGEYDEEKVWLFSHQAVIMSFRFVLEGLDEPTLLDIDRQTPMGNCSMTRYAQSEKGALELVHYADTSAVEYSDAPTTHEESSGSGEHQ
ncbi:MAG: histidine phosphatase family protein [Dermatophilus congolensis]|nr:histidine phosphatase family protein [Dermatophilus congolensis]